MTTIESPTMYKCDGCGKEEPWGEEAFDPQPAINRPRS